MDASALVLIVIAQFKKSCKIDIRRKYRLHSLSFTRLKYRNTTYYIILYYLYYIYTIYYYDHGCSRAISFKQTAKERFLHRACPVHPWMFLPNYVHLDFYKIATPFERPNQDMTPALFCLPRKLSSLNYLTKMVIGHAVAQYADASFATKKSSISKRQEKNFEDCITCY